METALERLTRTYPRYIDLSTGRVQRALAHMGNPHLRLPPVIHVAGTNGKGSTVAFMRSILESAGYRVHAFTSPHLVRYNERIRISGNLPNDKVLLDALHEIETMIAGLPLSWFEMTTVLALHLFAREPADVVLLETGLGGLSDATNVIDHPVATIITRISYDHTRLLGDTIEAIAAQKAGIIKRGVPVIMSWQVEADAARVIEETAHRLIAPVIAHGRDWQVALLPAGFAYEDRFGRLDLPAPGLLGRHQYDNAAAAIAALRHWGRFVIPSDRIAAGIAEVEWPGRLQRLMKGPLVESVLPDAELWLDGGHNDSGGEVLAAQASLWRDKGLSLVFGMLNSKQPEVFLKYLTPFVQQVRTVGIPGETNSLSAEECSLAAVSVGMDARPAASVVNAVQSLAAARHGPQRILICGSLHLAGHVLAENG